MGRLAFGPRAWCLVFGASLDSLRAPPLWVLAIPSPFELNKPDDLLWGALRSSFASSGTLSEHLLVTYCN